MANLIKGTSRNDRLIGTLNADRIEGRAGHDLLEGGPGNDLLIGGDGRDTARFAGIANAAANLALTGAQNTGDGWDTLRGIENLSGGRGPDRFVGDAKANVLSGNAGSDSLSGGAGDDRLVGGPGDDRLNGGYGRDRLAGGGGNDGMVGGAGNDAFTGGAGNDLYRGDSGIDTVTLGGSVPLKVDLSVTVAQKTGQGLDRFVGIEGVAGGSKSDVIKGNKADNTLSGGSGNDTIYGLDGNDTLSGSAGDDLLDAGNGNDVLNGGAGNDRLIGGTGADLLEGGLGNDTLDGGAGSDTLTFASGSDTVWTGDGADAVVVGSGATGSVVVRDFAAGQDVLDLMAQGAFAKVGNGALSASGVAEIGVTDLGSSTLLAIDRNGDGLAEVTVTINGAFDLYADARASLPARPDDDYWTEFYTKKTSGYSDGSGARIFFVDPTAGASGNDGLSEGKAWGSFHDVHGHAANVGFQPGDRILLKRGCTYDSKDGFWLKANGTVERPIVLGAYGNGEPPLLTNSKFVADPTTGKDTSINDAVLTVDRGSSHITIRDIEIKNPNAANITETGIRVWGQNVTIDNVEVSGTGMGVVFARNATSGIGMTDERAFGLVKNCFIHDLTMVVNTVGGNDDYGCQGVLIGASDITVKNNTFKNLMQASHDYRWDGAAVELYGSVHNVLVQANYIEIVNGFTELGGRSTDSVSRVSFDHNIIVNSESMAFFHNGRGDFGLGSLADVNFINNTVYGTGNRADSDSFAFGFGGEGGSFLNVQNNIFAVESLDGWDFGSTTYNHSNNLYDYDQVAFRSGYLGTGEYVGEAWFKDSGARDFRLTFMSDALGRASSIEGFLTDYMGRDLTGRSGLELGAIEYWG